MSIMALLLFSSCVEKHEVDSIGKSNSNLIDGDEAIVADIINVTPAGLEKSQPCAQIKLNAEAN